MEENTDSQNLLTFETNSVAKPLETQMSFETGAQDVSRDETYTSALSKANSSMEVFDAKSKLKRDPMTSSESPVGSSGSQNQSSPSSNDIILKRKSQGVFMS